MDIITLLGCLVVASFLSSLFNKNNNIVNSNKNNNSKIYVIDATTDMKKIYKFLKEHYEQFCTYPEILKIPAEDRLKIMSYIWRNWDYHIENDLIKKYKKYDKYDLIRINRVESGRIFMYYKMNEIRKMHHYSIANVTGQNDYGYSICLLCDIPKTYEYWVQNSESIDITPNYLPTSSLGSTKANGIYLFQDNDYIKVTEQELKQFCKRNRIEFYF